MLHLKTLYRIATVNGMAAFRLASSTTHPIRAELSTPKTIYCCVFCTLLAVIALAITYIRLITIILVRTDNFVGHIIYPAHVALGAMFTSLMCLFQVIHRKDYVRMINKSVALAELVAFAAQIPFRMTFFDRYCLRIYSTRVTVILLQVLISFTPMVGEIMYGREVMRNAMFAFVLYSHMLRTFFGLMFFCSLLVGLQLYRDVNMHIEEVFNRMDDREIGKGKHGRMQLYCDLSD